MRRALLITLALLVTAVYAGTARGVLVQWVTSADASYGLILAGVAAALIWRRRRLLTPDLDYPIASTLALIVVVTGCALFVAGVIAADLYTTRASFVLVAGGLVWFLAGSQAARALAAPLVFLLLAIPLPEIVVNAITLPLQLMASAIAETTLTSAGVAVFRDGNLLELPAVTLQVAEACSGLRSAVSLACVGVLLAWASSASFTRRALVVVAAVPIAVVANGLRIAFTGIATEVWGAGAARGAWHETAGWITFIVCLLALLAFDRWVIHEHPLGNVKLVEA